jgi:hypothetical protein
LGEGIVRLDSRKSNCPTRPFHLWNANTQRRIPSKYFSDPKRAHWAALKEVRWAKVGTTLEVLDVMKGLELGQYTRQLHTIKFNGR